MLKGSVLIAVVLLLMPVSVAAQTRVTSEQFEEWHRDVYRAAELYAAGDTAGALALLGKRKVPVDQQRDLETLIFHDLELGHLRPKEDPEWTLPLVHGLAALHMEGAFDAYDKKIEEDFADHIAVAEVLFAGIARSERQPDAAPAWELVIGLIAMSEVRLGWAVPLLDDACRKYPADAPLLLACGSVHEALAMLPSDVLARWLVPLAASGAEVGQVRDSGADLRARSNRKVPPGSFLFRGEGATTTAHVRQLDIAAKFLERVLHLDPRNVDAHIRLGHVLAMKGKDEEAVALFDKVLSGTDETDIRAQYMAALFLGAIHVRAKNFDRAAAQFRAASERIPTAQTAQIALAFVMHARGEAVQSATVLDRAVRPSDEWTDPWWGYRYGQYWIIQPLLASLLKDVTR